LEAIRQARWRGAKNPKAYIKTVARGEAVKLGLTEAPAKELVLVPPRLSRTGAPASQGDVLDELIRADERATLKRSDGVWRSGSGLEERDEREDWEEEFDSAWEYFLSKLPPDLKRQKEPNAETIQAFAQINAGLEGRYIRMRPPVAPNWTEWGQRAGFDEWEMRVLNCRLSRISRERALAAQPDDMSRKALQAAWKRFDRTGMERLRQHIK
jgi:hypothetical protein